LLDLDFELTDELFELQPSVCRLAQDKIGPRAAGSGTRVGLMKWGVSDERLNMLRAAGAFG